MKKKIKSFELKIKLIKKNPFIKFSPNKSCKKSHIYIKKKYR